MLKKGIGFYVNNFFWQNKIPKLYDKKIYPVDSTAAAQSIITLTEFDHFELAGNVAGWVADHFQAADGHIYFRKYKYYTAKVSFMRWSSAWMFLAFSKLLYKSKLVSH